MPENRRDLSESDFFRPGRTTDREKEDQNEAEKLSTQLKRGRGSTRSLNRAGIQDKVPWPKIDIQQEHKDLNAMADACLQVIIDEYRDRDFTLGEFHPSTFAQRPTKSSVTSLILQLLEAGYLIRIKGESVHDDRFRLTDKYLTAPEPLPDENRS